MALTVSTRPEKTVNSVLSRWNTANLPMQYAVLNTKWPVNTDDSTINITSITDDNGNAKINRASNDSEVAKEWTLIAGTTNYDGAHQIISIDGNNFTIDAPFVNSDTGTTLIYYKNYTSLIRVYAGLKPSHEFSASKPMTLIGTLEMLPDSTNLTNADVRDYVKDQLNSNYDPSQGSWPNDLNAWADFYIEFAERYDLVTAGVVGNFTSDFIEDLEDGNIVYCKGVHGALQFGYEFGGNIGEYVVNNEFYSDLALWMTFFERSKILDYHRFDISIILDIINYFDFPLLEIIEYDINGTLLLLTEQGIEDQDYGVYRLPISFEFQVLTDYITIQLKIGGIESSVLHTIDIDVDCFPFEGAPAAPSNLTAALNGLTQIDLVWVDNSDNETAFQIWRGLGSGAKSLLATVGEDVTTYEDSGLTSGQEYCYEVRSSGKGFSEFSNEACETPFVPFQFTVKTDNTSAGSTAIEHFKLPLDSAGTYNFFIDWGDGNDDTITAWDDAAVDHDYGADSTYTINIFGTCTGWRFNNTLDKLKILDIKKFGDLRLGNLFNYFHGCTNLTVSATDVLDTTGTTNFFECFLNCTSLTVIPNIGNWNMSSVTSLQAMFRNTPFNSDIGNWNVSSVETLRELFRENSLFNQDISSWVVTSVTTMQSMFSEATAFDQNISSWRPLLTAVNAFVNAFSSAAAFNSDISAWDVSSVSNMTGVFNAATSFNQNISAWNVSSVTNMFNMFNGATAFNQNISGWTMTSVNSVRGMFNGATSFNQNIGSWNVSAVNTMEDTFKGATSFNQNIGGWTVSSVTTMRGMFEGATSFNQDISSWNVANVTTLRDTFKGATAFDKDIGGWTLTDLTSLNATFDGATAFDQDLGTWDITGIASAQNMFNGVTLSTANYDALLIGWEGQAEPSTIILGGGGSTYSAGAAATARAALVTNLWTITDGGPA